MKNFLTFSAPALLAFVTLLTWAWLQTHTCTVQSPTITDPGKSTAIQLRLPVDMFVQDHRGEPLAGASLFIDGVWAGITSQSGRYRGTFSGSAPGRALPIAVTAPSMREERSLALTSIPWPADLRAGAQPVFLLDIAAVICGQGDCSRSGIDARLRWLDQARGDVRTDTALPLASDLASLAIASSAEDSGLQELAVSVQALAATAGFVLGREPTWRLHLRTVEGLDPPLLLVEGFLVADQDAGAQQLFAFLQPRRNASADALWRTVLSHVPAPFAIERRGSRWVLPDIDGSPWRQHPAYPAMVRADGRAVRIRRDAATNTVYVDGAPSRGPCDHPDLTGCSLYAAAAGRIAPQPGWSQQRVRLENGGLDRLNIFVGGYAAKSLGKGQWSFWAPPTGGVYVTALQDGRLIDRFFWSRDQARPVLTISASRTPQAPASP